MPDWLDITQIVLLLGACYACFFWGRIKGVEQVVLLMLDKELITEEDLEKLQE